MFKKFAPEVGVSPSTQNLFSQQILVWAPAHGNFLLKILHSAVRSLHAKRAGALLSGAQKIKGRHF
ncbi:MAG: hypothetical protein A3D37_00375 [Candidatus Zambryskibacteria bacterium RIFCSPHIGHO2_02_FULL_38_22]|uniref:Uncharacterized protein n=1 Tax=Candidatus Zambryskibacteria bacterium RIFCSPLOWO2_12_FULL_39_16 TaxID=1802775 RepID=A0A1G2US27_9BACT|nr:MAG: hypothetical protein A3D37_00375 [Candidatus Zambryskibacteria bacterium RIFCSPHIGHO2_02_FULL_38_22]OHB09253.1 MAG: hypothetical protein A3I19_03060 [Candidatus Zambryskibacteria bacterium RIFCSPLOWO2_02_FULL_38_13]OHB12193.1 MAG: hypothetical protein A3G46_00060 [Candidatus Zambryskibacteria bacterium RIFCSPLOWO2_12_FULL_39_16]